MAFPTGWTDKQLLFVNNTYIDSSLSEFTVLLTEANLPARIWASAQDGGGDLRFSLNSDGTSQLACEVVSFDTTAETAQIWVKVTTVSSSALTPFYIHWDTAGTESQPAASDTYGSQNAWDSNYVLVMHMEQDPSGSAPQMLDSTSNGNHGTSVGSMTSDDSVVVSAGKGLDLDGTDDSVIISSAVVSGYPCTLENIVRPDTLAGSNVMLSVLTDNTPNWNGHYLNISSSKAQAVSVATFPFAISASITNMDTINKQYVAGVFTSATSRQVFLNGVAGTVNTSSTTPSGMNNTVIGSSKRLTQDNYFNGLSDEIRISSVARSVSWIKATHNTINNADTFIIQGIEVDSISSEELFGTANIGSQSVSPSSIISSESFGSHQLNLELLPTSISSSESFGTSKINLELLPSSISSGELFGTGQVNLEIIPSSITSSESFGSLEVQSSITVSPDSITSSESFGTNQINLNVALSSISSNESFGTSQLNLELIPTSISSEESFGTNQVNLQIYPDSVSSNEEFGTANVGLQNIYPTSISSSESFGTTQINLKVYPNSISSTESFGTTTVNVKQTLSPSSIESEESFHGTTLSDSLISCWGLDETSGTRYDGWGTNNLTDPSNNISSVTGKISNAANFDSNTKQLVHTDNSSLSINNSSFSFSVWVNPQSSSIGTIASKFTDNGLGPNDEWLLRCSVSSNAFQFYVRGSTLTSVSGTSSSSLSIGTWYHIIVWYDADNEEIGIQVNDNTPSTISHTGGVNNSDTSFALGYNEGLLGLIGYIDSAKFWKRLLTDDEKTELYNDGSGTSCPDQILINYNINATSISSFELFGTPNVGSQTISTTSINSGENFGTGQIDLEIIPSSISSGESFGTHTVSLEAVEQTVSPTNISSAESFGTNQLNLKLYSSSISSGESFGTNQLNLELLSSSISSLEEFGEPQVNLNTAVESIGSEEIFGTSKLNLKLYADSISSSEEFGTHTVTVGQASTQTITTTSISSLESFGIHVVSNLTSVSGFKFKRKLLDRRDTVTLIDNRFTNTKLIDNHVGYTKISELRNIKTHILSRRNKTRLQE